MNETPARLEPNWNGALWKYFLDAYTWKKLIKFTSSTYKSIQFCYQKISLSEINWENFYVVFALSNISTCTLADASFKLVLVCVGVHLPYVAMLKRHQKSSSAFYYGLD